MSTTVSSLSDRAQYVALRGVVAALEGLSWKRAAALGGAIGMLGYARGDPTSVRRHGATTRRGADRTTPKAGRRAHDRTRTAPSVVAQRAEPRHTSTTPIEFPSVSVSSGTDPAGSATVPGCLDHAGVTPTQ